MSIIDDFKKGRINQRTLLEQARVDPALMAEVKTLLGEAISEDELEGIAAAGIYGTNNDDTLTGTVGRDSMFGNGGDDTMYGEGGDDVMYGDDGNDTMYGGDGNDKMRGGDGSDILYGGSGNDKMYGGDGSDILYGGSGNDYIDGGGYDGEDDIAYGGTGDDTFVWGIQKDGSDTFDGGSGTDTIKVQVQGYSDTLQGLLNDGTIQITLSTEDGDPIEITDDMWRDGKLYLPEGCTGIITGPTGETLTFQDVEVIGKYGN